MSPESTAPMTEPKQYAKDYQGAERFVYVSRDSEGELWREGFVTLDRAMAQGTDDARTSREYRPVLILDRNSGAAWEPVIDIRWKQT
jgi:hypothetical protein